MAKWNRAVKLAHFWNSGEDLENVDIDGLRDAITADPDLNEWYETDGMPLAEIETQEEFNDWLDTLYDFADDKRIWIPPH